MTFRQILVVQTAFIGDVILATGLLEKLHQTYPEAKLDFLVRKGNEGLTDGHPFVRQTLVWDKKGGKYKNLFRLIGRVRTARYDLVVNVQRFANSGLLTALSKAKHKVGFEKNPFSWAFHTKVPHTIKPGAHEVNRNHELIKAFTNEEPGLPRLYPSKTDFGKVKNLKSEAYICMAPASVWFTKQLPREGWVALIKALNDQYQIYLLGAPTDRELCNGIINASGVSRISNQAGEINLLQSAALMKNAVMNYVNDSAPMHLASAMNAATCAIFCSTSPDFGFGPLSRHSTLVEIDQKLDCRPCGLHGKSTCPKDHFNCGKMIRTQQLLEVLTLPK